MTGHHISNRVRTHPWRLTYTRMVTKPLIGIEPVGQIADRPERARWHILHQGGAPLCGQVAASKIATRRTFSQIDGERLCRRCHHEFSWEAMPTEVTFEDRGYETPCRVWLRGKNNYGYGHRGRGGADIQTHRAAYEQAYGPIPDGFIVHHKCEQADCLEPTHLEAMSRADHVRLHRKGKPLIGGRTR